jgi:hypothetical protein
MFASPVCSNCPSYVAGGWLDAERRIRAHDGLRSQDMSQRKIRRRDTHRALLARVLVELASVAPARDLLSRMRRSRTRRLH